MMPPFSKKAGVSDKVGDHFEEGYLQRIDRRDWTKNNERRALNQTTRRSKNYGGKIKQKINPLTFPERSEQ